MVHGIGSVSEMTEKSLEMSPADGQLRGLAKERKTDARRSV